MLTKTSFTRSLGLLVLTLVTAVAAGSSEFAAPRAEATTLVGDCTPGADWGTLRSDLAAQTVQLVNTHRASLGLRQLTSNTALDASSVWKARHMAKYGYMSHSDPAPPVARSTAERIAACGYSAGWGENIAYGYSTAQAVFNGWLNSSGHRRNIENPGWVSIGSGAAADASGRVFWAQAFGSSGSAAPPPPPAPAPPPPSRPPPPAPPPPTPPPPAPPAPQPVQPGPAPAPVPAPAPAPADSTRSSAPAPAPTPASPVTLKGLTLTPRHPKAGRILASTVLVHKRGVLMRQGHVFCSGRFEGRRLKVLSRRLEDGTATCSWRLPAGTRGKIVNATVIVQQGRLRVEAPFRTRIS